MTVTDIPRLYTALAEWLGCMVYVFCLKKRLRGWPLAAVCAAALGAQCGLQLLAGALPLPLWIPGMLANALLMGGFVLAACDTGLSGALYCGARAFTAAEFAASLEWQLRSYFAPPGAALRLPVDAVLLVLIYGVCYFALGGMEQRHFQRARRLVVSWKDAASTLLIAAAVFFASNISFVWPDTPFSGEQQREIFYIRTLVDLCGLVLLYTQQEQRRLAEAGHELEAIHTILHRQYDQYRQSKESIDLINRKYHDLKHQIRVIRAEQDPGRKQAYLDEMESGIRMVEAQNKTGNSVLDTILTGAAMRCAQENITLTAVADGTLVDSLDAMDLCTIFGNALDNAIESVEKIADAEKRLIRMAVFRQNDFALLRFENYFENPLTFEGGLPATTKQHRDYHGFGIKSIRYSAEKYGGSVTVNAKDGWFTLCVLLPLPKNAAAAARPAPAPAAQPQ